MGLVSCKLIHYNTHGLTLILQIVMWMSSGHTEASSFGIYLAKQFGNEDIYHCQKAEVKIYKI